ncbi:MAG: alpha/beta fold hydrolase [Planctomycetes bacterium]|nr:alpha/beta fold hydrolase [Planctomycetota bacterium]MCB9905429.1 alpha/beta fold hydrolase [Planctomycetota bacterium]
MLRALKTAAALPLALLAAAALSPAAPSQAAPSTAGSASAGGPAPIVSEGEAVEIKTRDNLTLKGSMYAPKKKGYRAPAALLVHGAGENRAELEKIGTTLQKRGFAVLSIDLRGHGDSVSEECDWSKMSEEDRERTWAYALRDIAAGAAYLRSRDDVHTSNLSIVGVRSGSAIAARYAKTDENVRALVLIAPQATELGFDLSEDLNELGGMPTLILASKDGRNLAERMQLAAHSANGDLEYVVVKAMRNETSEVLSDKRLGTELGGWLKDTVLPKKR